MRIRRASEYIRYRQDDTQEHKCENIRQYPEEYLRHAAPVWGPTWDRTNERLVRDEQEAE